MKTGASEDDRAASSKLTERVKMIVVIEVHHAEPLISPVYHDETTTEADVLETYRARFARLHERRAYRYASRDQPR